MTPVAEIRPLVAADLGDYKRLRDEMLLAHPEAFTSDAAEEKSKEAADYLYRLGLDRRGAGGHFLLGAWHGERLVGAVGCERELRAKIRHVGHIVGLMVHGEWRSRGLGRELVDACIGEARRTEGLELLILTVTSGNETAVRLYESRGFVAYGTLARAVRIGPAYHDKLHMALRLR